MEGKPLQSLRIALVAQGSSKIEWLTMQLFGQSWTVTMINPNDIPDLKSSEDISCFRPGEDWFDIAVIPQQIYRNGFQGKNLSRFVGKPVVEIIPPDDLNSQQTTEIIKRIERARQTGEHSLLTE